MTNVLLDAALQYARRGWRVFPAHTPVDRGCSCRTKECNRIGKHPRTKNGLTDATTDERKIAEWWSKWPDANVCVVTGAGVVVIDIDPEHHGDEGLAELERLHGKLPETVESITGSGGRHLFFRSSQSVRNSISLLGPGVDVRGDGGYVVAAPSLHRSGRRYTWEASHDPEEVPLAELPEWVLVAGSRPRAVVNADASASADSFIEGGRNKAMTSLAGSMRRRGMSQEAIEAALLLENAAKCRPPLDEVEVRRIAKSVARYQPGAPPAGAQSDGSWHFERGDHIELATATLARLEQGPLTYDEGEFWRYDEERGTWERVDTEHVAYVAASFAGCLVGNDEKPKYLRITDSTVRGAVSLARTVLLNRPERRRFADLRFGVGFRNGFAIVEGGAVRLLPHAPEHMCRYAFDFAYNSNAPADRLRDFFDELFNDVNDEEGGNREALLAEFVGACLTGTATKYQKLLLIQGGGGNGKSEFLRLARGLFPPSAIASLAPQDWGERFRPARLVGVLANFVDEIPEREVTAGDVFKSVITGDPLSTERKNRDPFEFRPIAGHILSANVLPGTIDQSDGYWRRFVVCPFTRNFENDPSRKADVAVDVLRHELPALTVWALEGAARLQRQGKYTTTAVAQDTLVEWRNEADPVRRFLLDRSGLNEMRAAALYDEWRTWARGNGFADMSSTKFGRRVLSTELYERIRKEDGRWYRKRRLAA